MNTAALDEKNPQDPDSAPEVPSYRSVHYSALFTLALGLLSALALTSSALWIVPVLAVVLGAVSLRSLASDPAAIGRRAALTGMVLAVLFGTWAWTARTSRDVWLGRVARQYTDQWIDLLRQQRLREAHQLHGRKVERAAPGLDLEDFYRSQRNAQAEYEQFFGEETLQTVVRAAREGQVAFDRVERCVKLPKEDGVVLRYVARYEQDGRPQELAVRITLKRERSRENTNRDWYVESVRRA
ncbi:MAG: hypothetical protein MUF48_20835 [Pirellulaceae bacterium]|jgi:hypothetical protein|nr:hypothetical protein [Pirellulaceae bacterium]